MKRLPLGIQTFSEIITNDYLYIDKTKDIATLIGSGKYFFLSRPRRFGKSLLVSTLKEIFSGNRELFKDLYIYDKIEWQQHPVLSIDFSYITYDKSIEIFEDSLAHHLDTIASEYNVKLEMTALKDKFKELIVRLSKVNKVAVLVDEYDKPIIDFITMPDKAKANREMLRNFFNVLKGVDSYLCFAFFTGVSKFSKVTIFFGLNNVLDITLDRRFSTMLGIKEEELRTYLQEHLEILAGIENESVDRLKQKIAKWYNGYSWDGINRVYNPTSLFTLLTQNQFKNYWFATSTPAFLISMIKEKGIDISAVDGKKVGVSLIENFDVDNINIYSLLFQTGYLTISDIREKREILQYQLHFPNFEVKESFFNYLLAVFSCKEPAEIQPIYLELIDCLEEKAFDRFLIILTSLFAGIPYILHIKDEKYYHSLCYMVLSLMGAQIDLEVLSDKGRVDGVLTLDKQIYVIEFKMGTAKGAMSQIKARRYYEQYLNSGKEVLLLGIGGFAEKTLEYCCEKADCL